jgi:hypothetical protein
VEAGRKAAHLAALNVLAPVQFEGLLADTRPVAQELNSVAAGLLSPEPT